VSPNWFLANWTLDPCKLGLVVFYCKTLLTPYVENENHLVQSAHMLDRRCEALA